MPLRIGLTGGIASGKSTVQRRLIELGVPVLDADQIARDVVRPGQPALQKIVQAFGAEILLPDGTLDRRRMRERVFADTEARRALEAITHPAIRSSARAWLDTQNAAYCVLSVAILIESGMRTLVDRVLVVDAPESTQRARLCLRDGIDPALADRMLAAQASRESRLAAADDVITNDGDLKTLLAKVDSLHRQYLEQSAQSDSSGSAK